MTNPYTFEIVFSAAIPQFDLKISSISVKNYKNHFLLSAWKQKHRFLTLEKKSTGEIYDSHLEVDKHIGANDNTWINDDHIFSQDLNGGTSFNRISIATGAVEKIILPEYLSYTGPLTSDYFGGWVRKKDDSGNYHHLLYKIHRGEATEEPLCTFVRTYWHFEGFAVEQKQNTAQVFELPLFNVIKEIKAKGKMTNLRLSVNKKHFIFRDNQDNFDEDVVYRMKDQRCVFRMKLLALFDKFSILEVLPEFGIVICSRNTELYVRDMTTRTLLATLNTSVYRDPFISKGFILTINSNNKYWLYVYNVPAVKKINSS